MEKIVLDIIFILFSIYAVLNIIMYLPRMKGWFASFKPQKHLINDKKNKLALIIPARNESQTISSLFDSINKQTYSRSDFDIYVIVKEENDPTIQMTLDMGGYPLVAPKQKCKGDALNVAFKNILENKPD